MTAAVLVMRKEQDLSVHIRVAQVNATLGIGLVASAQTTDFAGFAKRD